MRYQLFIVQSSFLSVYSIEMMLLYNFLDLVMIRIIKRLNHDYSKCLNRRLWHLATAVVGFAGIDSLFPKAVIWDLYAKSWAARAQTVYWSTNI